MRVLPRSEPLTHHWSDATAIAGGHLVDTVFLINVEFVAPELQELRGGAGNQRLSREGGCQLAIENGGLASSLQITKPLITLGERCFSRMSI